ncbi:MAG: nucleotidyl transferase AbiEii/AbiGii toxin family protein [Patescibacteria group bacterium]
MLNPYQKIFKAFDRKKIKYLIVGGVAVNLYGYSRFTGDIDILISLDQENLDAMEKLMHQMGYIERLPITLKSLHDTQQVKKWLKEKNMTAYTFISKSSPQLDIDILVENSIDFKNFYKRKSFIKIWDIKAPVISIDDLIKMKKKARRDKDLLDIKALLQLKANE